MSHSMVCVCVCTCVTVWTSVIWEFHPGGMSVCGSTSGALHFGCLLFNEPTSFIWSVLVGSSHDNSSNLLRFKKISNVHSSYWWAKNLPCCYIYNIIIITQCPRPLQSSRHPGGRVQGVIETLFWFYDIQNEWSLASVDQPVCELHNIKQILSRVATYVRTTTTYRRTDQIRCTKIPWWYRREVQRKWSPVIGVKLELAEQRPCPFFTENLRVVCEVVSWQTKDIEFNYTVLMCIQIVYTLSVVHTRTMIFEMAR